MDLILWRHAEAIDLELVGDDMARMTCPQSPYQAKFQKSEVCKIN
ncbi:MAG: hypothetical protein RL392_1755 [Pseudomonadota bacterium]|jgi:hypothetical protein